MIQLQKIKLAYGEQTVFDDISLLIHQTDRIGLVGRNGAGKTTFLRAILEPKLLDSGTVTIQKGKKVAYLPQEVVLNSSLSILDETFASFTELQQLQQLANTLEQQLAQNPQDLALAERYAEVQEQLINQQPDYLLAKTKQILMGLGFDAHKWAQPVSSLSVGWKMRIVLAKLLLQEADFYLFDEPTNHLDLVAKEWFLEFLRTAQFGFILICHERYFLDEVCHKILDLERGQATWYTGNYAEFMAQKTHQAELLAAAYTQQQKELKQKQAVIDKFKAGTRARAAQSMQKALDKLERIVIPPAAKNVRFSFPPVPPTGKTVLQVANLAQKFGDKPIFNHVTFAIERGQKVALIAPNGVGKTTLFNLITGALPLQQGTITFGHQVRAAIFAQDQNQVLNLKASIIDNLRNTCANVPEPRIRSFLGAFLFTGEDVDKKVGVLSGGEKNRVGMINVLLQNANLLLLDEPTNHLDIPSKEILLKALQEFSGTILFVSHDRDFINQLAIDILELTPTGVHHYQGNYDDYQYYRKSLAAEKGVADAQGASAKNASNKTRSSAKTNSEPAGTRYAQAASGGTAHQQSVIQLKKLEAQIAKLEQQISQLNHKFADLEYGTPEFDQLLKQLAPLQQALVAAEAEWESLSV